MEDPEVWESHRPLKRLRTGLGSERSLTGSARGSLEFSSRTFEDYTVGWICALSLEMAAAKAMLDEVHPSLNVEPNDHNVYTLGSISGHNVVITCLPSGVYGTTSAAIVASQMLSSFTSITIPLMVGIGGGVPTDRDIRLGDIVVSIPVPGCPAVIQYDYGKTIASGEFKQTSTLNKPKSLLLNAVSTLRANHEMESSRVAEIIREALEKYPSMKQTFSYPGQHEDILFKSGCGHVDEALSCHACGLPEVIKRLPREDNTPTIHYGPVASGNQVMKHGKTRDRIAHPLGILCFEMEAAGLMDSFPCLVIRGICDYCDAHKLKHFQKYAALAAAAYTKELLSVIHPAQAKKVVAPPSFLSRPTVAQRQLLMDTLQFEQAETRHATIKSAHSKTCKWLLKQPDFLDWSDSRKIPEHHGFLRIVGNPGTGKSTIMKFLLTHYKRIMTKDTAYISFFFNASGEELQRSTEGLYRSLLYQLLEKIPKLHDAFGASNSPSKPTDGENKWDIEVLQSMLRLAMESLDGDHLVCFIDALDECPEDQVRDMITFFKNLGDLAASVQARLHVCFASRHYPHITINRGLQIILEGQEGHSNDIAKYLSSELNAGHSQRAEQIRADILEKSSGIFLWVVLVVDILNKDYDHGRLNALRKRLQEIPTKLSDLFKGILTRDKDRMPELLLCIRWVLFARKPLSLAELYFAILSGMDIKSLHELCPEETTQEIMQKFIISSSKGLTQLTKAKDAKDAKVQFIHESVRDFLLREKGLAYLWSDRKTDFEGLSHVSLRDCCDNYLGIVANWERLPDLKNLPKAKSTDGASLRECLSKNFPFLEYAVRHILYHANVAEELGVPQKRFLQKFDLGRWVSFDNAIQMHDTRRHTINSSLLYICAEHGLPNLIRVELITQASKDRSSLDSATFNAIASRHEKERYGSPILAALANCNETAVRVLLGVNSIAQPHVHDISKFQLQLTDELVASLHNPPHKSRDWDRKSVLGYLAYRGQLALVNLLLSCPQIDPNSGIKGRTPLWLAVFNGHKEICKSLLADNRVKGNIRAKRYGETPLIKAICQGHVGVVKVLLEDDLVAHRIDPDLPDDGIEERSPLGWAAQYRREEIARILLDTGRVDPDAPDSGGLTPLHWAARKGQHSIVKMLLDTSEVKLDVQDKHGRTPLYFAAENDYQKIVDLLLKEGLAFNRGALLLLATLRGDERKVNALLGQCEEADCSDSTNILLWCAAKHGHRSIVELLLEAGAEIDSRFEENMTTPLGIASEHNHAAVVEILLDNGAAIDLPNKYAATPLYKTVCNGHDEVVRLLLERGAEVNSKNYSTKDTPLQGAVQWNHETIARLLLKWGASIDLESGFGLTPRAMALRHRHGKAMVKLLDEWETKSASGSAFCHAPFACGVRKLRPPLANT